MHDQTKEHICATCGKSFTRADKLRQHELVHVAKVDKPLEWVTIQSKVPPAMDQLGKSYIRVPKSDSSSDESSDSSDDENGKNSSTTSDSGVYAIKRYAKLYRNIVTYSLVKICIFFP